MTRIKRGFVARQRRKKVLKLTKGFRGSSSVLFRPANQRKMKALRFSYRDRRQRKRDLRSLWITRINAAARRSNLNYNQFIYKLKQFNIIINRKWLAQLAIRDSKVLDALFQTVC